MGGGGVDVAVRLRSNAAGELVEPEANVTVRIRWRGDVSALARLVDPTGRLWFVNGYVEVGRRQWIDLSLSAFGLLLSGGADSPAASPPAGWQWQDAGGVWVNSLVIRRFFDFRQHPVNDGNSANYWAFTVTAGDWQLAGDFESGPIRAGFPVRVGGRSLLLTGFYLLRNPRIDFWAASFNHPVGAGGEWPAYEALGNEGVVLTLRDPDATDLDSVSALLETLAPGDVVSVVGGVS